MLLSLPAVKSRTVPFCFSSMAAWMAALSSSETPYSLLNSDPPLPVSELPLSSSPTLSLSTLRPNLDRASAMKSVVFSENLTRPGRIMTRGADGSMCRVNVRPFGSEFSRKLYGRPMTAFRSLYICSGELTINSAMYYSVFESGEGVVPSPWFSRRRPSPAS